MPLSRSIAIVACIAGLVALPAATEAQKTKPRSAASHLIKTPKGNQLVVPITVRYRLDGKGKSLKRSRLSTRLAVAARLPSGRVLRASERRTLPGKARVKVEHYPFFSVRQTRVLRKALAAKQRVKLAVASSLQADLDGDGDTDARTSQSSTQVLAAPTPRPTPSPVAHQRGNDPCGVLGQPSSTCTNVTGSTWTANHTLSHTTITINCPSTYPYSTGSVSTQTSSKHYTQTVEQPGTSGGTTQVTIWDDNSKGHPITYTPTAACSTQQQGGGGP